MTLRVTETAASHVVTAVDHDLDLTDLVREREHVRNTHPLVFAADQPRSRFWFGSGVADCRISDARSAQLIW